MMSSVNASSSARPFGVLRWVERCWPRTLQAKRSETENFARRSGDGGKGSEVSRGSLFQDQLLERQVRHCLAQPVVLFLKLFQALYLIALQATKLLAPAGNT